MTFLNRFRKLARNKRDLAKIGIKVAVKKECKWPYESVGHPDFRFCCAEVENTRFPYCNRHCKIAYLNFKIIEKKDKPDARSILNKRSNFR